MSLVAYSKNYKQMWKTKISRQMLYTTVGNIGNFIKFSSPAFPSSLFPTKILLSNFHLLSCISYNHFKYTNNDKTLQLNIIDWADKYK